jgi:hypothetical protein
MFVPTTDAGQEFQHIHPQGRQGRWSLAVEAALLSVNQEPAATNGHDPLGRTGPVVINEQPGISSAEDRKRQH